MKFTTYKASDWSASEIEINTLEELLQFQKDCHNDIIISPSPCEPSDIEIIIYDGSIEEKN